MEKFDIMGFPTYTKLGKLDRDFEILYQVFTAASLAIPPLFFLFPNSLQS